LEILPTLAAVGRAKLPDGLKLDGFDMLSVLKGEAPSKRNEMFWDWPSAYQAARVGNYKWIASTPRDQRALVEPEEGLYDLTDDPGETRNLIEIKPDIYAMIKKRFAGWQEEMQKAEPRGPFRDY
jgi:arylsulfatase A-like enzyme